MSIPAGTKLGPYEVVAPLGAGGMGEVYRVRDPRIGRDIALKVLPESLASDESRLSRFAQEARAAGVLDFSTGERSEWQELRPADPAGVMNIQPVQVAANLETYAYRYRRLLSELFVVKGLL